MGPARRAILIAIMACMVGVVIAGRFKKPRHEIKQPKVKNQTPEIFHSNEETAITTDPICHEDDCDEIDNNGKRTKRPKEKVHPKVKTTAQLIGPEVTSAVSIEPASATFSTPQDCARTCRVGQQALNCHYTFVVEYYATLTNACKFCRSNATTRIVDGCQCVTADGYELSGIITVNRMYPGPSIVVCEGDNVIIDVDNRMLGAEATIHWHGIQQRGTPHYDGVPFVTQCPIPEGTTFRYQWKARSAGTHFWHSHSGLQKSMGLVGAIVIREPRATEPYSELWDEEDINHVIFATDWLHDAAEEHFPGTILRNPGQSPDNILINGMGRWTDPVTKNSTTTPRAVFTVRPGRRYRFRFINSASFTCPFIMTIEGHKLTVISSDGEPLKPVTVDSINSFSAERYDFVINANNTRRTGDFWIQIRGTGVCESLQLSQLAVLRYETDGQATGPPTKEPTYALGLPAGVVLNQVNVRCDNRTQVTNAVCITQLESVEPVPLELLKKIPDVKMFLPFGFFRYDEGEAFRTGTTNRFLVNRAREFASLVSNISNVFPSSPLLTQFGDIGPGQICEPGKLPPRCPNGRPCFCAHVREIKLNSVVELILVDEAQIRGLSHPFHLHGFAFHVLGEGCGDDYNISSINVDIAKNLDKKGEIQRDWRRPPAKDTFALPNNGFSIIRFIADNPGYWLFHCHFLPHLLDGMSLIFHVGEHAEQPPVPKNFPKCGNFQPGLEL